MSSTDKDRRAIFTWVFAISALVGLWVILPMIQTFISLATHGEVDLTLSRPDQLSGPDGASITGVAAAIPVDVLGDGARTALIIGTALQLAVVAVMLLTVDVVLRSMRRDRMLTNRTKVVAMAVVILTGFVGLVATHVVTSAGVLACQDLYGTCSEGRTWDDPMTNAFPLVGIGLALVFALVRSESVARRESEGLV